MDKNNNSKISDAQYKAIELLASGENKSDTARLCGVSRQTIDNWTKNKEFKSALDEYKDIQASLANTEMNGHAKSLMNNLIKIALTGHSEKNRLDATIYGLNRIYGTPTNKTENVNKNDTKEDKKENKAADINALLDDVDNKVIPLDKAQ